MKKPDIQPSQLLRVFHEFMLNNKIQAVSRYYYKKSFITTQKSSITVHGYIVVIVYMHAYVVIVHTIMYEHIRMNTFWPSVFLPVACNLFTLKRRTG